MYPIICAHYNTAQYMYNSAIGRLTTMQPKTYCILLLSHKVKTVTAIFYTMIQITHTHKYIYMCVCVPVPSRPYVLNQYKYGIAAPVRTLPDTSVLLNGSTIYAFAIPSLWSP